LVSVHVHEREERSFYFVFHFGHLAVRYPSIQKNDSHTAEIPELSMNWLHRIPITLATSL